MERRYLAYMLRLWRVGGGGGAVWRASLESPPDSERHVFASLHALLSFLEAETGALGRDQPLPPSAGEPPGASMQASGQGEETP